MYFFAKLTRAILLETFNFGGIQLHLAVLCKCILIEGTARKSYDSVIKINLIL